MFRSISVLLFFMLMFTGCFVPENLPASPTVPAKMIGVEKYEKQILPTQIAEPVREKLTPTPIIKQTSASEEVRDLVSTHEESSMPAPITAEDEVARLLSEILPPRRDDERLAAAYKGFLYNEEISNPSSIDFPIEGSQQSFRILNVVDNTVGEIQTKLLAVSDHAYFWFDMGPGAQIPDQDQLQNVASTFDDIYENVVEYFGSESNPGIDGDQRLHVVSASPIALCGVTEETASQCYLAGLVQPADLLPATVDPRSNEREMFVMNAYQFGTESFLGVLAHEFRHMIEDNYDRADTDWEKEGSATLAAQLAGYPSGGIELGNIFLDNPDQQLDSWTEDNTAPYYGQGYIFNRYIFDKLGKDLYLQFATSPLPGLHAIDVVAEANDLKLTGESLWLDWLVSLVIHDHPRAPERYRFESQGLKTAASTSVSGIPADFHENVHQYAADYYELPENAAQLSFSGDESVPLLGTDPMSGENFWFAQRGNNSNPRLTREVDLTDVDQAALSYHLFADIEYGYDFAYVSISADGGHTWEPLEGDHMQGLDPADNPAGSAFADRFYTGRSRQWVEENIDLSPYAGQSILLRFEYVTDPILTYGGVAIDDIAIPEIGLFDDVESDDPEWLAEGFIRATPYLPQKWHLQLITFEDNGLNVQELKTNKEGDFLLQLDSLNQSQRPILVVAASAPTTLEVAKYELKIR